MNKAFLYLLLTLCFTVFFEIQETFAGPGGKILKEMFSTPLGKIIGLILGIIFLPWVLYVYFRQALGTRRTLQDLQKLAQVQPDFFGWFNLKNRMTEVFGRVHSAWRKEDMSAAAEWMTHWYWQNQQLIYLDRWQEQGLVNICNVRKILAIKPLHLNCSSAANFEGSRVVAIIEANMEDYLAERETGKVVEGKKGYKNGETVWTFVLEQGKWKVENIEESDFALAYAKLKNVLPTNGNALATVTPSRINLN